MLLCHPNKLNDEKSKEERRYFAVVQNDEMRHTDGNARSIPFCHAEFISASW